MKFLVPNYSCLQNPWLGGYHPQLPILSVLNWICWTPPSPEKTSWVRHWQALVNEVMNLQHHRLYSPGWSLVSSSKCRQRPLSWTSVRQFLQPIFPASFSTPSIHLDFGRPRPRWPLRFVHNIFLCNSLSSIRTTWHVRLSLVDFIPFTMAGSLWSSSRFSIALLPPPRPSFHIGPNICEGFSFRFHSDFFQNCLS